MGFFFLLFLLTLLIMQFFDDCNGVGHASVPRRLRSGSKLNQSLKILFIYSFILFITILKSKLKVMLFLFFFYLARFLL